MLTKTFRVVAGSVLSLAVLAGCGGPAADDRSPDIATLRTAEPGPSVPPSTAARERPVIRPDEGRAEFDRYEAVWRECLYAEGVTRSANRKRPTGPVSDAAAAKCAHLYPENWMEREARTNPEYTDRLRETASSPARRWTGWAWLTASDAGPGPQVMIGRAWFTVVGILATTPLSPDIDRSVLVGWDAARSELGFDGHPTVVYVQSRDTAVEAVRAVLSATIHPESPGQVQVTRPSDALAAKRATENTFSALFLALAAVALLVGGIGVANTMVISVLERRSEIGLRRALGANRGQIRGQFLTESVLLAGLGGVLGTAMGLGSTALYATYHGWPLVVPLSSALTVLGGAVLVGMIAGVYPSIRASRLTPTEALASA